MAAGTDGFRSFALDHPDLYRLTFEQILGNLSGRPRWAEAGERARRALERWVTRAVETSAQPRTDIDSIVVRSIRSAKVSPRPRSTAFGVRWESRSQTACGEKPSPPTLKP